jgi:hypothetical protein
LDKLTQTTQLVNDNWLLIFIFSVSEMISIDEKGTLKTTKHHKYENIAGLV